MHEPKEKKELSPERIEQLRAAAKKGGEAKKGKMSSRVKKAFLVKKAASQRIYTMADKLLNSQVIAAIGTHRMVVMSEDDEGKKHLETIRDETRMQNLLDSGVYGEDYIILAGREPDWKAAEALLNRGLGKATENIEVNTNHTFTLTGLARDRQALPPAIELGQVPLNEIEAP